MIHRGIFKRKRTHSKIPGGFFSFEEEGANTRLYGFGHGEHLRLRDEFGNIWRGTAEKVSEESVLSLIHIYRGGCAGFAEV